MGLDEQVPRGRRPLRARLRKIGAVIWCAAMHQRPNKPALRIQPTTLWEYPSQHYGTAAQGDSKLHRRDAVVRHLEHDRALHEEGDLVVDPFCGSGTTLDVAKDTGRKRRGFDLAPYRADIEQRRRTKAPARDARSISSSWIRPTAITSITPKTRAASASSPPTTRSTTSAMHRAIRESARMLKPGGVLRALRLRLLREEVGFAPVGFQLFMSVAERLGSSTSSRRPAQQVARDGQLPQGRRGRELLPARLQLPVHRPEARHREPARSREPARPKA